MKTKVAKWGNSLALRIPKGLAETHQLSEGTDLEILEHDDGLHLRPIRPGGYTLSELLEGVSPDNLHQAVDSGDPQGKEAW